MAAPKVKILLVSRKSLLAGQIERLLRTQPAFEVDLETSPVSARRRIAEGTFHCLVLNLNEFGYSQFDLVSQIRKLGHRFPILIFAESLNGSAVQAVEALQNVVVFSRALIDVDQDFLGLCTRFIKDENPPKRGSKRHLVRQKGLIENTRTGHRFTCHANNLSAGGVLIEFGAGSLLPNDLLKITIQLPHLKKVHMLRGRVIWVRTSNAGVRMAGVRFVTGIG